MLHRTIRLLTVVVPIVVIISVWFPLLQHYYVPGAKISGQVTESARKLPSDSVLQELDQFQQGMPFAIHALQPDSPKIAEAVLQGELRIPGKPAVAIHSRFSPDDLAKMPGDMQLEYASFIIPIVFIAAYEQTKRDVFLLAARDFIFSWAAYERHAWLPRGYLWNDHAVATRAFVVANFWRYYRHHPSYNPEQAREFLRFVALTGQRLAKPSLFTYATNHGVIQNLALLHLGIAFPALPAFGMYRTLALTRLEEQLGFYLNDEGVILEHSAQYQEFGIGLLSMGFRYMTLIDKPVPKTWIEKYEKAIQYYAMLRRPDGSLPRVGDTASDPNSSSPTVVELTANGYAGPFRRKSDWKPARSHALYPAAGYAVWWNGLEHWPRGKDLSQTLLAWSYYRGHGHKHADELSIILWAGGDWWTNVGYWPYSTPKRSLVESWEGSNAPHLVNEARTSRRTTHLLNAGWSEPLAAIDLERRGPDGFTARRQVINVRPNLWIIVDSFADSQDRRVRTVWTSGSDVTVQEGSIARSFKLVGETTGTRMAVAFLGSNPSRPTLLTGSTEPFGGWVVSGGGHVMKASAFMLEQPSRNSWSVNISLLETMNGPVLSAPPEMLSWNGPQDWQLRLPTNKGDMRIHRMGATIDAGSGLTLVLDKARNANETVDSTRSAYIQSKEKYGEAILSLIYDRWRVTYILIALLCLQEIFLLLYQRYFGARSTALSGLAVPAWIILGIWLSQVYFQSYRPLWDKVFTF